MKLSVTDRGSVLLGRYVGAAAELQQRVEGRCNTAVVTLTSFCDSYFAFSGVDLFFFSGWPLRAIFSRRVEGRSSNIVALL